MKTNFFSLTFLLLAFTCPGQDASFSRNVFFSTGLEQVKEGANLGLVFNGPSFNYGANRISISSKRAISFSYELGVATLFSKRIPALGVYLKPAEFTYMFNIPVAGSKLFIGPSVKFEYNYFLYPQLQSGFDYWLTDFSCGINALYDFTYKSSAFRIYVNSSVLGFVSRQPANRDPYFFDVGFKPAIQHLHQDLTFASFEKYNTASFEVLWKPAYKSGFTIGYVFDYSGYHDAPDFKMISHSIKVILNKK
jgi:hypothetical protein